MRFLVAIFLTVQMTAGVMAFCNEVCHDGEVYSDSAEMCVAKEAPAT